MGYICRSKLTKVVATPVQSCFIRLYSLLTCTTLASQDCSLLFPAALLSKASLLGHKGKMSSCVYTCTCIFLLIEFVNTLFRWCTVAVGTLLGAAHCRWSIMEASGTKLVFTCVNSSIGVCIGGIDSTCFTVCYICCVFGVCVHLYCIHLFGSDWLAVSMCVYECGCMHVCLCVCVCLQQVYICLPTHHTLYS